MGCGCSTPKNTCSDCCNNTDPCVDKTCGCEVELDAACIRYSGEDLPCAGIVKGDTIEAALAAISEKFCGFSGSYVTVVTEESGENCENGGVLISVFDSESDTLLDAVYLCTPTCDCPEPAAKENFYEETISTLDITTDPSFVPLTYFQPAGYETLTYTNSSGLTKDYIINVSYESSTLPSVLNESDISNWLDGAIIKTDVSAVDTVEYESLSTTLLSTFLFDGLATGDTVTIDSIAPDQVLTTAGNPVEVRFLNGHLPKNTSFFKKVTLDDTETISLQFKSKDGNAGWLLKAQMFINEL